MKELLITFLILQLFFWSSCEAETDLKPKVIGGIDAEPGEFPFLVGIYTGPALVCAGVLIRENLVLTTAFCLEIANDSYDYFVYAGMHNISSRYTDPNVQRVRVSAFLQHPDFFMTGNYTSPQDVGLAYLSTSFNLTDRIKTIELPKSGEVPTQNSGIVAGWGPTNATFALIQPRASILQKLEVSFGNNETCAKYYQNYSGYDPTRQFCAGNKDRDICFFDDLGGPFLLESGANRTLYALISYGGMCENTSLTEGSIYTRLPPLVPWIEARMKEDPPTTTTTTTTASSTTDDLVTGFTDNPTTQGTGTINTIMPIFIYCYTILLTFILVF